MNCQQCGAEVPEGAVTCPSCKQPLAAAPPAPESMTPPPGAVPPPEGAAPPPGFVPLPGVPPGPAPGGYPMPPKRNWTPIIIGIVVGVLVIVGIVLVLVFTVGKGGGGVEGTYKGPDGTIELMSGNKCKVTVSGMSLDGTYSVNGDKVVLKLSVSGVDMPDLTGTLSGDTLKMAGAKYVKQ